MSQDETLTFLTSADKFSKTITTTKNLRNLISKYVNNKVSNHTKNVQNVQHVFPSVFIQGQVQDKMVGLTFSQLYLMVYNCMPSNEVQILLMIFEALV